MTTSQHNQRSTMALGVILRQWLHHSFSRWMQRRKMVGTMRALHSLPDMTLRDIGIHRSEIGGVASYKQLKNRF
jgi:uncharacterized protein YjiS (DUF1127 family)